MIQEKRDRLNLPKAWNMLRCTVQAEQPEPFGLFLCFGHDLGVEKVLGHGMVHTISDNVEA